MIFVLGKIEPKRIRVFAPSNNNLPKFNVSFMISNDDIIE